MELMDIVAELKNASVQMPEEKIDQFIEAVDTHERIFVYGTGRSGLMLKALAMRLMQMGISPMWWGRPQLLPWEKGTC